MYPGVVQVMIHNSQGPDDTDTCNYVSCKDYKISTQA